LTGDGMVNLADRDTWLAEAGEINLGPGKVYLLGDATLDGTVAGRDFLVWNSNKFTAVAAWCSGDFNASGFVDGDDFLIWNNFKFHNSGVATPIVLPVATSKLYEILDEMRDQAENPLDATGETPRPTPLTPEPVDSVFAASHRGHSNDTSPDSSATSKRANALRLMNNPG
jgi:hypothetical protein